MCGDVNAIRHLYLVSAVQLRGRFLLFRRKVIQILRHLAKDGNDEYSTPLLLPSRGSPVAANVPSEGETLEPSDRFRRPPPIH